MCFALLYNFCLNICVRLFKDLMLETPTGMFIRRSRVYYFCPTSGKIEIILRLFVKFSRITCNVKPYNSIISLHVSAGRTEGLRSTLSHNVNTPKTLLH
jgi:hypothetical protein